MRFFNRKDKEVKDVRAFMEKFDQLVHDKPVHLTKRKLKERADFLQEELDEFKLAMENQDLPELADALIDLVYVAKGTAVMLGLPWEKLWDDVQRANMAKERGIGKRGHLVDCVKPAGWWPPQTYRILYRAGYNQFSFVGHATVAEELCHDDPEHKR